MGYEKLHYKLRADLLAQSRVRMDTRSLRARSNQSRPRFQKAHHNRIHDRRRSSRVRDGSHNQSNLGHQHTYDSASIAIREERASDAREPPDPETDNAKHIPVSDTDRGPSGTLCGCSTGLGAGHQSYSAIHDFRAVEGSIREEEEDQTLGRVFPRRDWEAARYEHYVPVHHDQE